MHTLIMCASLFVLFFFLTFQQTNAQAAINEIALNYSDLVSTGKFCPLQDSCASHYEKKGTSSIEINWESRNCFCDNLCVYYGDCCIDAANIYEYSQSSKENMFVCKTYTQYKDIYVRQSCSPNWKIANVSHYCQINSISDIMLGLPVTSMSSGFTYTNIYCAICNFESFANVTFWRPRFECPSLHNDNRTQNITQAEIMANLTFSNENQVWRLKLFQDGVPVYHMCHMFPVMPPTITNRIRPCQSDVVSSCLKNFTGDSRTVRLCDSYTAIVYAPKNKFRNVHCAICNNVSVNSVGCKDAGLLARRFWSDTFNKFAFSVLFDVNWKDGTGANTGVAKRCDENSLYDPFFKLCRQLYCLNGQYINGTCGDEPLRNITTTKESIVIFVDDYRLFTGTTNTSTTILPAVSGKNDTEYMHFYTCPKFQLSYGEYEIRSNGTAVYVEQYDKVFLAGQFDFKENNLLICVTEEVQNATVAKFSQYMSYITIVGLGISIVSLVLQIGASFLATELQNLSGKNLTSLSVALLASYLTFITAMLSSNANDILCSAIAVIMYYFFLASFVWMLIISIDISLSIKKATTELRLRSGSQWKRFLVYSLMGWMIPALFVIVSLVVEHTDSVIPTEFRPGFGNRHMCWFSSKKALLVYFAVPFATIMCINMFLFISSAFIVFDSSRSNAKLSTAPQINFVLYLKLALLMGLTWIIGLVASFAGVELIWYVFILLNTLQGLFIFIAFTCSKRVGLSVLRNLGSFSSKYCHRVRLARTTTESHAAQHWSRTSSSTVLKGDPTQSRKYSTDSGLFSRSDFSAVNAVES